MYERIQEEDSQVEIDDKLTKEEKNNDLWIDNDFEDEDDEFEGDTE